MGMDSQAGIAWGVVRPPPRAMLKQTFRGFWISLVLTIAAAPVPLVWILARISWEFEHL